MNRYHQRRCQSAAWAEYLAGTVLPRALDGLALGPRVLELGPGYGASTGPLSQRAESVTALEADPLLARRLRDRLGPSVEVVTGDARDIPFAAATFSAVVCFTMLHHLPCPRAQDTLFAQARRVLVPGGVFAGTDSLASLRFRLIHLGDVCTPVDPAALPGRLAEAGFTRISVVAEPRLVSFAAHAPDDGGGDPHD
jgi:SAM-dependent methyltransferase